MIERDEDNIENKSVEEESNESMVKIIEEFGGRKSNYMQQYFIGEKIN